MTDYIRRDTLIEDIDEAVKHRGMGEIIGQTLKQYIFLQPAADVAEACFPAELHVGDRAWKKAMSILDKKYAEAKKLPFVRDPLAWALYHTWKEFDDGKRCD